jgi:hypothetical protein
VICLRLDRELDSILTDSLIESGSEDADTTDCGIESHINYKLIASNSDNKD